MQHEWGRECVQVTGRKPEGKRPKYKWVDNIKLDLVKMGLGGLYWIGLAQILDKWRALVNEIMNFRIP